MNWSTIDANGNLLNDGTKSYTWDAQNRLVQVNILNAQPSNVADTVQMTYDAFGRRASLTELHGTTVLVAKTFVWCGAELCQERDSTGHTVNKQFFNLGEVISGTKYFFTKDHLGNIREMTDTNGAIHANYDYDPYGRQTKLSGDLDADFGYTGFYMERAAGLDLTWFRAYDATKGRWLNRDPLGEQIGTNLYAMVLDNPLGWIDPLGLCGGGSGGGLTPGTGNPGGGGGGTPTSTPSSTPTISPTPSQTPTAAPTEIPIPFSQTLAQSAPTIGKLFSLVAGYFFGEETEVPGIGELNDFNHELQEPKPIVTPGDPWTDPVASPLNILGPYETSVTGRNPLFPPTPTVCPTP